jgi:hypothetical protein
MNQEGKGGTLANTLNKPIDGVRCERAAPLGCKDEATVGELPAQLPQCAELVATERMHRRLAVLDTRTCKEAERPNSTCDHSRSQISAARRLWRKATRIRVTPCWAVFVSRSTSARVRYSRDGRSVFAGGLELTGDAAPPIEDAQTLTKFHLLPPSLPDTSGRIGESNATALG